MIPPPKKFKCQLQQALLLPDFQSHPDYPNLLTHFSELPNPLRTLDSSPIAIPGSLAPLPTTAASSFPCSFSGLKFQINFNYKGNTLIHSPYKNLTYKFNIPFDSPNSGSSPVSPEIISLVCNPPDILLGICIQIYAPTEHMGPYYIGLPPSVPTLITDSFKILEARELLAPRS